MTDQELLELAAKAAGVVLKPVEVKNVEFKGDDRFIGYMAEPKDWPRGWFGPLTDDGDALRLAVMLGLSVEVRRASPGWGAPHVEVYGYTYRRSLATESAIDNGESLRISARRAIVRAAAEIGKAMP